jgi:hypothetical protein
MVAPMLLQEVLANEENALDEGDSRLVLIGIGGTLYVQELLGPWTSTARAIVLCGDVHGATVLLKACGRRTLTPKLSNHLTFLVAATHQTQCLQQL